DTVVDLTVQSARVSQETALPWQGKLQLSLFAKLTRLLEKRDCGCSIAFDEQNAGRLTKHDHTIERIVRPFAHQTPGTFIEIKSTIKLAAAPMTGPEGHHRVDHEGSGGAEVADAS